MTLSILLEVYPWLPYYAFGVGIIIGSFLNVVIYRFHTGRSINGHSHCMSCGERLRWFELFPLLSFLCLRGRCRTCSCRITPRYALVEFLTGALFTLSLFAASTTYELLFLWLIMSVLVVITVYDINHYIIPDKLVLMLTLLVFAMQGYAVWLGSKSTVALTEDFIYALAGAGFFLFLWVISKGKWLGFGDVKLAFPLALIVGAPLVFSMVVFSFWIGTIVSLSLIGVAKLQRGKLGLRFTGQGLTIKSVVPFAPFLIAGCLLVFFTHINVISIFSF